MPTCRSPRAPRATIDGVVACPSEFGMTTGRPPSMTATQELVVPRSMPIIFSWLMEYLPAKWVDKRIVHDCPGRARYRLRRRQSANPRVQQLYTHPIGFYFFKLLRKSLRSYLKASGITLTSPENG